MLCSPENLAQQHPSGRADAAEVGLYADTMLFLSARGWQDSSRPEVPIAVSLRSQVSTLQGIGQDCVVVLPGGCLNADTQPVFFNFTTLDSTISPYWMERWEVGVD